MAAEPLRLPAATAAELLLVREAIAADTLALPDVRHRLSDNADDSERLVTQARAALAQDTALARLARQLPWLTGQRPGAWLLLPALLAGALFSGLTAGGRFNILAPPLLGLLIWQFVVYVFLLWPRKASGALPTAHGARALLWLGRRWVRPGAGARLATVPGRFIVAFAERAPALLLGRLAATLHAAAAAFALGAILGIYWDGLGVAYHAYWESTFLGAGTVSAVIGFVLTPASLVTGIPLPDAEAVAAIAAEPVPAAPWIHLWAVTLLGLAILPRLLLTAIALYRVHRAATVAVDTGHPIFRSMLASLRGTTLTVKVQPLGYRPDAATLERLRSALDGHFHGPVQADVGDPAAADAEALPVCAPGYERLILLLSPAQTPEPEIHEPLFAAAAEQAPICVVLDANAYSATVERRASRMDAWRRLLEARDIEYLELEVAA